MAQEPDDQDCEDIRMPRRRHFSHRPILRKLAVLTALVLAIGVAFTSSVIPRTAAAVRGTHGTGGDRDAPAAVVSSAARGKTAPGVAPAPAVPAGDEIVTGTGDLSGWHLFAASSGERWRWHWLATLRPPGGGGESWIGQQCLTGDDRLVIAVVAPWSANNSGAGLDRGALAYAVDAHTGVARPLASGVSLAYFNPGCGTGHEVALTSYIGTSESQTRITVLDASTGRMLMSLTASGEITSAVPVGTSVIAAKGSEIVRLSGARQTVLARMPGQAFDLHPNSNGGVDFMVTQGRSASVWRLQAGAARRVASGTTGTLGLYAGRGGHNVITGAASVADTRVTRKTASRETDIAAVSLGGQVAVEAQHARVLTGQPTPVTLLHIGSGQATTGALPVASGSATVALPRLSLAATATSGPGAIRAAAAANTTTPACAVPRNDLWNQVFQPNAPQIDWAIQQAVRGWLVPGNIPARPAAPQNYKIGDSQNLPSYYPSQDFPPPAIAGHPGAVVPPQVMYGILAQESNWNQASWHALAGYGGNPLVANYYGSTDPANPTDINYDNADCGYGLGQLTDIMKVGAISQAKQVAVATGYAENVAAAVQALVTKWNQLASLGDIMNNGDPTKLENWYAAIWAYNSGVHTTAAGDPGNGLGWLNNPANPIYPPNRTPFLRDGYSDASHPQDWPYQEKVFGWMETAQTDPNYNPSAPTSPPTSPLRYTGVGPVLNIPASSTFCSPSVNNCDPSSIGKTDPCPAESSACWWNQPVQWANCATECTSGSFTISSPTAPEPASTNRGIPCADRTSVPSNAVIVDDTALAGQNPAGLDPNVVSCPTTPTGWSQGGAFELDSDNGQPGQPGNPIGASSVAAIDLHQLGGGFGGHFWFTHTRPASDAAHEVVAKWTPNLSAGLYQVQVYVPDTGATTTDATYQIHVASGYAPYQRTINQNAYSNQWVSLGYFPLRPGSYVTLGSVTPSSDSSQGADIAFDDLAFSQVQPADTVSVNANHAYGFQGWGTSLAWWAEVLGGDGPSIPGWSTPDRAAAESRLFGAPASGGLGLTIARYNIGASPLPGAVGGCPSNTSFRPGGLVPSPQQSAGATPDIGHDPGQLGVLQDAITDIRNANGIPVVEAFANSPPWWMTSNKCQIGAGGPLITDNLPSSQYQAYASYLAGVVRSFASHGIAINTIEPFNEPDTFPWGTCTTGCQEGANFVPNTQNSVLTLLCSAVSGLGTKISVPDENKIDNAIADFAAYSAANQACVSQINTHGYDGQNAYGGPNRPDLAGLAQASGKPLWMSEFGTGGSGIDLSKQIALDLQYLRPSAWVYWQAIEEPGKWGLLQSGGKFPADTGTTPTQRFYALGQYSKFIRPGFRILTAYDPQVSGGQPNCAPGSHNGCSQSTLDVAAYNPANGQVVLVATNNQSTDKTVTYDLSTLTSQLGISLGATAHVYRTSDGLGNLVQEPDLSLSGTTLPDVQPAQSITTYVIDPPA
jgi:O-glycosyl hydrolase